MDGQHYMERYIQEVVRRLPKGQRAEIALELQEMIQEMLSADGEEATVESVLLKLGPPKELAKKYRDDRRYLVSPEYFDNYLWVLRIVLLCVGLSVIFSAVVNFFLDPKQAKEAAMELLYLPSGLLAAFGAVTLLFVILERLHVKFEPSQSSPWNPSQLPPLLQKKAVISRSDTVVGLVFIVLFCMLLTFAPQVFSLYLFSDSKELTMIPVFDMEHWNVILPLILASMMIGLVDEVVKLVTGRYCGAVLAVNAVTNLCQVMLSFVVLKMIPFWNPEFFSWLRKKCDIPDLLPYITEEAFSNLFLGLIVFGTALELGTTAYKSLRYGKN
ncbi:HAAS signaling domain-containing protein [Massiliimalia timonensis]|uniref:HAAS signaling domain-containing protein n=1 Tax=Massiliimalia timonensis TaxID=1987501 RepID=UPI000B8B87FF|nr:hypothetical protein [Massiliimalia timonensis]MBS7175564.1 hypothetical protein [Clostridiales bacterium]